MVLGQLPLSGIHELAHLLAGRRLGLRSRIRLSNRFYFVVFETTLDGLVSVPRRRRFLPMLAGMGADLVVMAALTVAAVALPDASLASALCLALAFSTLPRIVWQGYLFLQTDIYFLVATLLGCIDLHATSRQWIANRWHRLRRRPDRLVDEASWHPGRPPRRPLVRAVDDRRLRRRRRDDGRRRPAVGLAPVRRRRCARSSATAADGTGATWDAGVLFAISAVHLSLAYALARRQRRTKIGAATLRRPPLPRRPSPHERPPLRPRCRPARRPRGHRPRRRPPAALRALHRGGQPRAGHRADHRRRRAAATPRRRDPRRRPGPRHARDERPLDAHVVGTPRGAHPLLPGRPHGARRPRPHRPAERGRRSRRRPVDAGGRPRRRRRRHRCRVAGPPAAARPPATARRPDGAHGRPVRRAGRRGVPLDAAGGHRTRGLRRAAARRRRPLRRLGRHGRALAPGIRRVGTRRPRRPARHPRRPLSKPRATRRRASVRSPTTGYAAATHGAPASTRCSRRSSTAC